jgi:ABC-2 type transport system permease protein
VSPLNRLGTLGVIARRDLTEYLRDGRLHWAGGLVLVLLLTALAVGWQNQRAISGERAVAQKLDYKDWVSQNTRHPHDAAHQGMHVFKPEPPLSVIDPGITPYVGSTLWLQAHRQSEVKFRPAQDATGLQRLGQLSAAWVLQVLGPLLIVVLGFNAFAGERERGTLRQTLSLGITPRQLMWGKALGLCACLAVLLMPAGLATLFASLWGLEPSLQLDTALRLLGLGLGYGVYLLIAVFVVLAVSGWARSSRISLVVLLGLWIVGTLMVPRAASDLARTLNPSPTRLVFSQKMNADLGASYQQAWKEKLGSDKRWGADVPLNKWGIALQIDDQAGYGVTDKHFGNLWDAFEEQQRSQVWAGLVVPLLALRSYSMGMASTDFVNHRDFSVAAEQHRRLMQDLMSADLVKHADTLHNQHFAYQADAKLWATVPRFSYQLPSAGTSLENNLLSLLVLLVVLIASILVARVACTRPMQ